MGNKSKQRSKLGKWKVIRDMAQAHQPSWPGLSPLALRSPGSTVGISATDKERAHPLRQQREPETLQVIFSGGTARRLKAEPVEINHVPQPWQKAADKAKERALKKPQLGWNERRLARERRKESEAQLREDLAQVA